MDHLRGKTRAQNEQPAQYDLAENNFQKDNTDNNFIDITKANLLSSNHKSNSKVQSIDKDFPLSSDLNPSKPHKI